MLGVAKLAGIVLASFALVWGPFVIAADASPGQRIQLEVGLVLQVWVCQGEHVRRFKSGNLAVKPGNVRLQPCWLCIGRPRMAVASRLADDRALLCSSDTGAQTVYDCVSSVFLRSSPARVCSAPLSLPERWLTHVHASLDALGPC